MKDIETGRSYHILGKMNWASVEEDVYVISDCDHTIVDTNAGIHSSVMNFFSPEYDTDESVFESMVVKPNTRILMCYNLEGLIDIPDVYDDASRIMYIPECIIDIGKTALSVVAEKSNYSIVTPFTYKGSVHPKNIRERALVMKDILQKVIPGCDVRFQGTSTTFKSKTFVDNEVARGEDENRANLDKKNKEETQYIRARKELNTMMSALDREQSSVTAKVAYATKKSEEAYAAMNDMQQFLNILSANYNWEDLLKDPKHSELLASMKNIQNGVFFET